jgi:beta-glucosidase
MNDASHREVFRDPAQPLAARVSDLVSRLTLTEKIALLHQHQAPVPRLGIGQFRTGTEALHGLAWLGPATVFPQALGLASTWNPDLVRAVGAAVGEEVRGFHHKDPERASLNVWAPVVNLLRDPRWGRNEEGYSEDPWLTGRLGTAYAEGLRGDHPRCLRTAPTLKHFLGYNNETERSTTSSAMSPRVLHEYELPAFRAPIESGAAVAVMASYNLVNGRPAHLSPLINDELRGWTDDEVLVVGDAGAGSNIAGAQGYHPDHAAGFAAAVRAGIDSFTEDNADSGPTVARLTEALERGLLRESDVDRAVRRSLSVRFRLGEFDPPEHNPYTATTAEVINCAAHQALAREAARQALVLLRNDGLLPLDRARTRKVAVVGPLADTLQVDWYSGTLPYTITAYAGIAERAGDATRTVFHEGVDRIALHSATGYVLAPDRPDGGPLYADAPEPVADTWFDVFDWGDGVLALRAASNGRHVGADDAGTLVNDRPGPGGWVVRETFRLVEREPGRVLLHHLASDSYVSVGADAVLRIDAPPERATAFAVELVSDGARAAAAAARDADVAVVVVGNHPMVNGRETEDRGDLALPADQEALIRAVYAANPRTVLVVSSSYPYALRWADEHLPAILWSAHGGQEYGAALAEVLFGDASPGGRLTQTWYRSTAELPDLLDYDIITADATYLYFRGAPLYAFGHGLTYSDVEYADLRLSAESIDAAGAVTVSVDVRNLGPRPTDEVVQLYTRQQRSRVKQPVRQLRDFRRVHLAPGERTTVHFGLPAAALAFWDVTRARYVVENTTHTVSVGRSSADLRLRETLRVVGTDIPPRDPGLPLAAADHDDYAGVTLVDAGPDRGDAVTALQAGGWLAFQDLDFGTGYATCRLALSRTGEGPASVTLRLDDPFTGALLAVASAVCGGDRYDWAEVSVPVRYATGRGDLYVVFDEAGVNLRGLAFEPARPGGS